MLIAITDFLWAKIFIYVLLGAGFLFTISTRFAQFRYFARMFSVLGAALKHESGRISSFQALMLSVAGRVGAGNIAGVAIAITIGGPGAIFWMWIVGLIGMATSLIECSLAQLYKSSESDGTYRGGPAFYISQGLGLKWLASLFSILLLITFGYAFSSLQSFTLAASFNDAFSIPFWVTGVGLSAIIGVIVFGGVKRIVRIVEYLVPVMVVVYFTAAIIVIGTNLDKVPTLFEAIIGGAFGYNQAIGGGLGAAIMMGVRRGLLSNEAGLGSAPNVAAIAHVKHPVEQGIVQSFSVFIDTIVLCTATALIILLSDVIYIDGGSNGVLLTQLSLAQHLGAFGAPIVTMTLLVAGFTSIIYNYYLGENSISFLQEERGILFVAYRITFLTIIFWGSVQDLSTIFAFVDLSIGVLAMVNLFALVLLFKVSLRVIADFDEQIKMGVKEPVLETTKFADLKIEHRAWATTK